MHPPFVRRYVHGHRSRWLCHAHGSVAGVLGAAATDEVAERPCDMCTELAALADEEPAPVCRWKPGMRPLRDLPPPVFGGQGRSSDDQLASARAIVWCAVAGLVVWTAVYVGRALLR